MRSGPPAKPRSVGDRLRAGGFDRVGGPLVVAGALLILAAFTALNWFRDGSGFFAGAGSHSTFHELHNLLEQTARQSVSEGVSGHVTFGASRMYFAWLGWLLLVGALGFGGLAVSSVGARRYVLRWLGAVVAATGIGFTFLALNLITFEGNATNNANAPTYGDFIDNSGVGTWCAIAGFLLIVVGSLVHHDRP